MSECDFWSHQRKEERVLERTGVCSKSITATLKKDYWLHVDVDDQKIYERATGSMVAAKNKYR